MSTEEPIDFYAALEVDSAATQQQIRDAYKRFNISSPDFPHDKESQKLSELQGSAQNASRPCSTWITRPCQSNSEYDSTRRYFDFKSSASTASSSRGGNEKQPPENFPWSSFGFSSKAKTEEEKRRFESEQFGDIFEEMLRDENLSEQNDKSKGWLWSVIGTLSGAAMGFIMANLPGLVTGAVAGNRLGAIRDVKGKSLYEAFQELPAADKTKLLSELATKILSHAVGL
ncbi:putative J domain-containing protein C63.13 [Golovinomyces cichoracearum]|uniref:Putative J domain-containing protein C63.13 n=1 Tax=Golovinomyces cichoracearum TaxID=62708 RepID=A0A420IUN6_9PEZI|nr:putative J domain-containing protein C63.13 [Golovinomyces cichoracearum]